MKVLGYEVISKIKILYISLEFCFQNQANNSAEWCLEAVKSKSGDKTSLAPRKCTNPCPNICKLNSKFKIIATSYKVFGNWDVF